MKQNYLYKIRKFTSDGNDRIFCKLLSGSEELKKGYYKVIWPDKSETEEYIHIEKTRVVSNFLDKDDQQGNSPWYKIYRGYIETKYRGKDAKIYVSGLTIRLLTDTEIEFFTPIPIEE